jgi:hypothetical protein
MAATATQAPTPRRTAALAGGVRGPSVVRMAAAASFLLTLVLMLVSVATFVLFRERRSGR